MPAKEADTVVTAAMRSPGHGWRQVGIVRRTAGEVAMWGADPRRPLDLAQGVVQQVQRVRTGHRTRFGDNPGRITAVEPAVAASSL